MTDSICRIHLVRHGATPLNQYHRYRGQLEVPLDEKGWADAHTAAAELAGAGLNAAYTSPLRRAQDTARTIATAAGLAEIHQHYGLNNVDYGSWTALTSEEARQFDPVEFERYQTCAEGATCPGGESLDAAADRVVDALIEIGRANLGSDVVVVSHAAMVRLALVRVGATDRPSWRRSLPNGSITVFEVTDVDALRFVGVPDDLALVRH